LEGLEASLFVLLLRVGLKMIMNTGIGGMILTEENKNNCRKTCSSDISFGKAGSTVHDKRVKSVCLFSCTSHA
jgi:hypothetical protein